MPTAEYPFPDSEIAAFTERPTPAVTSGKITKVAKVNGTWLIWFNGEPPTAAPPAQTASPRTVQRTLMVNTSMVGADQYVPGDQLWQPVQNLGRFNPAFARYAGAPSGCALRRSAEFAGFLPHDLYRCADADYRELS